MAAAGTDGPRTGRALRGWLAVAVAAGALAAGAAQGAAGAIIEPAIGRALAHAGAGARVPVLVVMRRQVAPRPFHGNRVRFALALRRAAATGQTGVSRVLARGGPVRHLWLVNAVAGRAGRAQIRLLAHRRDVRAVSLDRPVTRVASLEVSPLSSPGSGNWGAVAVRAPQAWTELGVDGTGMTIGSIDTGVDPSNPELAGKIVAFRDFVNGRTTPYDDNGHGTHTIGTMVGAPVNGAPIGVAPGAKVIVAKAMDANGVGTGSALLAAAQWMADPDGNPQTPDQPTVVNNSWSAPDPNDPWFRPMLRAWLALGIVPVFAAGNDGTVGSPAGYPDAIAVGAVDQGGNVPSFSGRSQFVWRNLDGTGPPAGTVVRKPDLVAPGVGIMSTYGDGWMTFTGTSMAAPHVAATVALMREANPSLTPDQILSLLRESARDVGPPGPDLPSGAGELDTLGAVALAEGKPIPPRDATPVAGPVAAGPAVRGPDSAAIRIEAARRRMARAWLARRITGLRVTTGRRVVIRGNARHATRLQVALVSARTGRAAERRVVRVAGRFRIDLRVRRGRYRLELRAVGHTPIVRYARVLSLDPARGRG